MSVILIFKCVLLALYLTIGVYLIYTEMALLKIQNKNNLLESSNFNLRKVLRDIFVLYLPVGLAYLSFINRERLVRIKQQSTLREQLAEQKAKELLADNTNFSTQVDKYQKYIDKFGVAKSNLFNYYDRLDILNKKREELISNKETNPFKDIELAKLDQDIIIVNSNLRNSLDTIRTLDQEAKNDNDLSLPDSTEIKKSMVLGNFDLHKFFDTLSDTELLAFAGLILNALILNYTISIILIFYGEYLIKRFNLEVKYPKLATFIKFRRSLMNFYLKVNFLWIFLAVLPQISMYLYIIYPKILSLIL